MFLINRIHPIFSLLKKYLLTLNVYTEAHEDSVNTRRIQILATRMFVILLIQTMGILIFYTVFIEQKITVETKDPSRTEYERLQSLYPITLSCPCSQIGVSAGSFIKINVTFHQVCSSDFIKDVWISSLLTSNPSSLFYPLDIRHSAMSQFQMLSVLCRTAENAVSTGLSSFASSKVLVPAMIPRATFDIQVPFLVQDFRNQLLAEQQRRSLFIRVISEQTQLPSALFSSYRYTSAYFPKQALFFIKYPLINQTNATCSCQYSFECVYPAGIYNNLFGIDVMRERGVIRSFHEPDFWLPGMMVGCFPLNSLLHSTFECLFNSTCLQLIVQSLFFSSQSFSIKSLNSNVSSRFLSNTTVGIIADQLMIETWSNTSDYNALFEQCRPISCTFSFTRRAHYAFTITTLTALFGGVSVVLKLVSPILVMFYQLIKRRITNRHVTVSSNSMNQRLSYLWKILRDKIVTLNLFKRPYNNEFGRRSEILTTRLYVLLFSISIVILIFYTSFAEHTETKQIEKPTFSIYKTLVEQYGDELSCPCTQITAPFGTFVTMKAIYHPLCSSIFTTDAFLPAFPTTDSAILIDVLDFSFLAPVSINLGIRICALSEKIVDAGLNSFYTTNYVSAMLTNEAELFARANKAVNALQKKLPNNFKYVLQLMRDNTNGNQLLTASLGNAFLKRDTENTTTGNRYHVKLVTNYAYKTDCFCGTSFDACSVLFAGNLQGGTIVVTYENRTWNSTIYGLFLACNPLEGVLHSTLECLFDEKCLLGLVLAVEMRLISFGGSFNPHMIRELDQSLLSVSQPNTTVINITNELMIEQWISNISFDKYFQQCQPNRCVYMFSQRLDLVNNIVTVIGLAGGLSVVLRILAPLLIAIIRQIQWNSNSSSNVKLVWMTTRDARRLTWFNRTSLRSDQMVHYVRELNLFQSADSIANNHIRRNEILTTRLYIFLLFMCLLAIVFLTVVPQEKLQITIKSPSLDEYDHIQNTFDSVVCYCSSNSIPHSTFVSFVHPTFHQICSSALTSEIWISNVFGRTATNLSTTRIFLSAHFRLLRSFCLSSRETLSDGLTILGSSQFVTSTLLSRDILIQQINITLTQFYIETPTDFSHTLDFILGTTLSNQIISVYESNWYLVSDLDFSVSAKARFYGNCSCASLNATNCLSPMTFDNENFSVDGMFLGCLPLSSLLHSSLSCFYDEVCLQNLKSLLKFDLNSFSQSIKPLDSNVKSRFSKFTRLKYIINSLMVEQWTFHVNYSSYFHQCKPTTCSYSILRRNNVLDVTSRLIGFYGGITVVLGMLTPRLVQIKRLVTRFCQRKPANQIVAIRKPTSPWLNLESSTKQRVDGIPFCEYDRKTNLLRERANSLSDFSFLAVGFYMFAQAIESKQKNRVRTTILSTINGFVNCAHAFGSWMNHACRCQLGHRLDLTGMWLIISFITFYSLTRRLAIKSLGFSLILFIFTIILWILSDVYYPESYENIEKSLTTILISIFLLSECFQTIMVRSLTKQQVSLLIFGSITLTIGVICGHFDATKTFCWPQSWFQLHAIWHFSAACSVFAVYKYFRSEEIENSTKIDHFA